MSSEHQALVFNAAGLTGSEKLFLLAVCEFTDQHGKCTAGVKRLAHMTGTSESTVKTARRKLEARNLMIKLERKDAKNVSQHNIYRVNLDALREMHDPFLDDEDDILAQLQFKDADPDEGSSTGGSNLDPPHRQRSTGGSRPAGGESDLDPPLSTGGSNLDPPQGADLDPRQNSTHPHPETETEETDPETSSTTEGTDKRKRKSKKTKTDTPRITDSHKQAAQAILQRHDLSPVEPRGRQHQQIRDAVALAFAHGYAAADIHAYFEAKLNEAHTVTWLCGAFQDFRLPAIDGFARSAVLGEPCGQCDARPHDPVSARVVWLNDEKTRSELCRRCHPKAIASMVQELTSVS